MQDCFLIYSFQDLNYSVLLTWPHKTLDDFGGKLGLLFHSEVTVSSKPNVWTERWPLTWCFGGASSSLRGIVFWQVRYDRCWHSWHKLNFSAEQIRPSGALSLPLVYVADIFRPHFTQPKKKPHPAHVFFHGSDHLYVGLLFTYPIKD